MNNHKRPVDQKGKEEAVSITCPTIFGIGIPKMVLVKDFKSQRGRSGQLTSCFARERTGGNHKI